MVNVILCGGSGTRLWPLSRSLYPKQFVPIFKQHSLFQETVMRNGNCDRYIIVTSAENYFIAESQLEQMKVDAGRISFILEPCGRNTAPAIALAALKCNPDEILIVSPSDHIITDITEYSKCLDRASKLASENDKLVTFGIKPDYPETGFGYVEAGKELMPCCFEVKSFREKPDLKTAETYITASNFSWNSGMFVFKAGSYLKELENYSQEILLKSRAALEKTDNESKIIRISKKDMLDIPSNSIDYAVMEKSRDVAVVLSDFGWSDLGSFDSLYDISSKDEHGNSESDVYTPVDSRNNLVIGGSRKIFTIGIEDSIIIDTEDALLVSRRGESQKVRDVVELLKKGSDADRELLNSHVTVHRPWGTYTVLLDHGNYKIKKILVRPGFRLSLQKHVHRNEHWVIVSGEAEVTIGDKTVSAGVNEPVYIKAGEVHRLSNRGVDDLVIIETQIGEYVGEDDIIRIEDDFSRI